MMFDIERVSEPDAETRKSLAQKSHEIRIPLDQDQPVGIDAPLEKCCGNRACSRSQLEDGAGHAWVHLRSNSSRQCHAGGKERCNVARVRAHSSQKLQVVAE